MKEKKHTRITLILISLLISLFSAREVTAIAPGGPATLSLQPQTALNIAPGSYSFDLMLDTGSRNVFGMDLYSTITTSDSNSVSFSPSTIPGFDIWSNSITPQSSSVNVYIAFGTAIGNSYSNSSPVSLGTFTVNGSANETIALTYTSNSAVYEDGTYTDILDTPANGSFSFTSDSSPSPTDIPPTDLLPTDIPPANGSLIAKLRLQGITSSVHSQDITLTLKENMPVVTKGEGDGGNQLFQTSSNATPDATGIHTVTYSSLPTGTFKTCFTAKSHLQRCVRDVTINSAGTTLDISQESKNILLVGDLTGVGNNNNQKDNVISSDDISAISAAYTGSFVITGVLGNPEDVNNDGRITIDDLALAILNFSSFRIPGDE